MKTSMLLVILTLVSCQALEGTSHLNKSDPPTSMTGDTSPPDPNASMTGDTKQQDSIFSKPDGTSSLDPTFSMTGDTGRQDPPASINGTFHLQNSNDSDYDLSKQFPVPPDSLTIEPQNQKPKEEKKLNSDNENPKPVIVQTDIALAYHCQSTKRWRKPPPFKLYVYTYRVSSIGKLPLCKTVRVDDQNQETELNHAKTTRNYCTQNFQKYLDEVQTNKANKYKCTSFNPTSSQ